MVRDVIWIPYSGPGLEHLCLMSREDGVEADSLVIGVKNSLPFRIRYQIYCDKNWQVRGVNIDVLNSRKKGIQLITDGEGNWKTRKGESIPSLQGCRDVDISVTPFTNTLPIRRLDLAPQRSADARVVYIAVPEILCNPVVQRYTYLGPTPEGRLYRYENLEKDFSTDILVDFDGLIIDYPETFKRIWSSTELFVSGRII
jgi:uncharacterized protein